MDADGMAKAVRQQLEEAAKSDRYLNPAIRMQLTLTEYAQREDPRMLASVGAQGYGMFADSGQIEVVVRPMRFL